MMRTMAGIAVPRCCRAVASPRSAPRTPRRGYAMRSRPLARGSTVTGVLLATTTALLAAFWIATTTALVVALLTTLGVAAGVVAIAGLGLGVAHEHLRVDDHDFVVGQPLADFHHLLVVNAEHDLAFFVGADGRLHPDL